MLPLTTSAPRNALITGASRGLGLALTSSLARDGWGLVVDGRHTDALTAALAPLGAVTNLVAIPGDIADDSHRHQLATAVRSIGGVDLVVLNAGTLGPSPLPRLSELRLDDLRTTIEVNLVAQLGVLQAVLQDLRPGATVVAVTSDAAVEPYEGWGAYGAAKAGLEQLAAVLGVERPDLRVLRVDPGDMRTAMHQDAFPGEDISDRPGPEEAVPGLRVLIEGDHPSGRYQVSGLPSPLGVA
ncbi:MAG: SDR family oxidoreductase [Acidimicrobiales bacterium]